MTSDEEHAAICDELLATKRALYEVSDCALALARAVLAQQLPTKAVQVLHILSAHGFEKGNK